MKEFLIHAGGIGTYLVEAGVIYGMVSHEYVGFPLIVVAGFGFLFICAYIAWVASRATRPAPAAPQARARVVEEEPHVLPTPWPLVFSVATVLVVVGAMTIHWVLIAAAAVFVAAGVGWLIDVMRQWRHPPHHAAGSVSPHGPVTDAVDTHEGA